MLVSDLAETVAPALLPHSVDGGSVAYLQLDTRDIDDWQRAVTWVVERWGGLDMLVNNAGVGAAGRIEVVPIEDWLRVVDVNLLGVVKGCQAFTPLFKAQRSDRIVNVASMAGLVHPPCMSSYNAAKAGVVALSETLLHELAPFGIDVSVVCPSFFRTNLAQSIEHGSDPAVESSGARLVNGARLSADTVATRTAAALDKGRFLVLPNPEGRLAWYAKRYAGPLYHATMKRVGARRKDPAQRLR